MVKTVEKRDGHFEEFKPSSIFNAVSAAMASVKKEADNSVINDIVDKIQNLESEIITVEEIQDFIENYLMEHKFFDVAKSFIIYREEHKNLRKFVKNKENFISRYRKSSNTANATIDDNSNVACRNIGVLNSEIHKEDNIQISRGMVMRKLAELYPDFNPKQYIRDLNKHIIYKHDESSFAGAIAPYCASISMYPFLTNGIKNIGGLSAFPKNIDSFCGIYINLIFSASAQFAGAIATPEFLLYFDYFARREWGDDYYQHLDEDISCGPSRRKKTIRKQIHQYFQQVIYSINQPSGARGLQSAFVNFSYYDKPFFESMFGEFVFPDGTKPIWESLSFLQKDFMMWFNEERLKSVITFPVESFALIYKDGKFVDEDSFKFVCEEYERGHSFFTYISDTVDSLSSCCFTGEEIITIKNQNGEETKKVSLAEFVDSIDSNYDLIGKSIEGEHYVSSYNIETDKEELSKVIGILKKPYTGNLYTFDIGGKKISITEDHLMMVKDLTDNLVKSISAKEVYENKDRYLVAVE